MSLVPYRTARATCNAPAALAGGASPQGRCRGCGLWLAFTVFFAPAALADMAVSVPSGQGVALHEVLVDTNPGETWLRFRFVAPAIARSGGSVTYDNASVDMDHLCGAVSIPYLAEHGLSPARIVVSMSDRAVPFGATDPDATQYFEAYRVENDTCIWEEF